MASSYEIQITARIVSENSVRTFKLTEDNTLILLAELAKELPVETVYEYEVIKDVIKVLEES